jgi:hypothetical protein
MSPPPSDLGSPPASLGDLKTNLHDADMGFFLIDRKGVVRYVTAGPYSGEGGIRGIPSTDEIVRELERAR